MKPLNYYNELSAFNKQISYSNVQFLGIEYINDNPLLRFKLENGNHFRRQLNDNSSHYEHIPTEKDDKITNKDISNIKFTKFAYYESNANNNNCFVYSLF